jgi:hypothetical protein
MSDEHEEEREGTKLDLWPAPGPRGMACFLFNDMYGQRCSLQQSSLASEGAIWFGIDSTGPHMEGPGGSRNEQVSARMHLTQTQMQRLLPFLQHFAKTGDLPREES